MIPLAQYLSDAHDDEFVPLRPVERRSSLAQAHGARPEPLVVRTLKPMAARPGLSVGEVLKPSPAQETVPAAVLQAARDGWEGEKARLARDAEEALTSALAEQETRLAAEAAAETEARLSAQHAELTATFEAAVAAERERWTSQEADRLADLMILQMAVFEDSMRATVRSVLKPLAMNARERQAIDDLAEAVKTIAPRGEAYRIDATGPSDLLAKFRDRLGPDADLVAVRADEDRVDIRIDADSTTIETRLGAWGTALEKALS